MKVISVLVVTAWVLAGVCLSSIRALLPQPIPPTVNGISGDLFADGQAFRAESFSLYPSEAAVQAAVRSAVLGAAGAGESPLTVEEGYGVGEKIAAGAVVEVLGADHRAIHVRVLEGDRAGSIGYAYLSDLLN